MSGELVTFIAAKLLRVFDITAASRIVAHLTFFTFPSLRGQVLQDFDGFLVSRAGEWVDAFNYLALIGGHRFSGVGCSQSTTSLSPGSNSTSDNSYGASMYS